MFSTFLMAYVLFTLVAVGLITVGIYLFAEAKWNKHPMASCTYRRAASFVSSY